MDSKFQYEYESSRLAAAVTITAFIAEGAVARAATAAEVEAMTLGASGRV
jgi:hypothetical protein